MAILGLLGSLMARMLDSDRSRLFLEGPEEEQSPKSMDKDVLST